MLDYQVESGTLTFGTVEKLLIDFPQGVSMRAVLHSTDPDVTDRLVWVEQTNTAYPTDRMRGCPCS